MCTHQYLFTNFSQICTICGIETPILNLDVYNVYSAPMTKNYDRGQRFKLKVEKLLLLHSGPKSSEPVWRVLEEHVEHLLHPMDIRTCLRKSKIKSKHYDCIHLFSKIFCNVFHEVQDHTTILATILKRFQDIYFNWKLKIGTGLFFSSDWLLRHLVSNLCPDLVVFLKPKTSQNRHDKYVKMLQTISR